MDGEQRWPEASAEGGRRTIAVVGRGARSFTAPHAERRASPPAPALTADWTPRGITTATALATPRSHRLQHSPASPQAVSPRGGRGRRIGGGALRRGPGGPGKTSHLVCPR